MSTATAQGRAWCPARSAELYQVDQWGQGAFGVNELGHVVVHPHGPDGPALDLFELLPSLRGSGLSTPLLVRFPDLLARRVEELLNAFRMASEEYGYRGRYRGVFPIKVNQQRHVVEEVVGIGSEAGIGLEVGSKPELLAAIAVLNTEHALLVCNGYKDRSYIETALLAQQLGRNPILVIDRFAELELVLRIADELQLEPTLGIRARLSAKGAGKWVDSTGERSKFGLTAGEIVAALELLEARDRLSCVELLHFHIGSQITAIRAHKDALREATRIWVGLHEMGARPTLLDVGGGLGVDYDGSQTDFHSSMNYSVQEYANDVVATVLEGCEEAGLPHPDLITEAGRAMVAQHSVLLFDVLGVSGQGVGTPESTLTPADHRVLHDLEEVYAGLCESNVQEAWHDLQEFREEVTSLFALGYLDLRDRARAEHSIRRTGEKLLSLVRSLPRIPEDLAEIETSLADVYYGNFSMFQSLPDHWGFKQLFPVMPLHRLGEEPTRRGVVADLTCDSDGKIGKFIAQRDVREVLELHPWTGDPYYLGVFMVGAYQEILGDMHNLFGDTDAVHVRVDASGAPTLEHIVAGDTVREVLAYVQFDSTALVERIQKSLDTALRAGLIDHERAQHVLKRFRANLEETTYLAP